jgi:hypothetical protein
MSITAPATAVHLAGRRGPNTLEVARMDALAGLGIFFAGLGVFFAGAGVLWAITLWRDHYLRS